MASLLCKPHTQQWPNIHHPWLTWAMTATFAITISVPLSFHLESGRKQDARSQNWLCFQNAPNPTYHFLKHPFKVTKWKLTICEFLLIPPSWDMPWFPWSVVSMSLKAIHRKSNSDHRSAYDGLQAWDRGKMDVHTLRYISYEWKVEPCKYVWIRSLGTNT